MLRTKDLSSVQRKAANLIIRYKKLAILMKPGSGKTSATLHAMTKLSFVRCLIVGTPRICDTVWEEESQKWQALEEFTFTKLAGTPNKRRSLLDSHTDFHLISYDLLKWLSKELVLRDHYDAVIFDELTMLKSPSTARFKAIRTHIDHFDIAIGLTGTPTGNSLLGMWSQAYACVGSETPLGKTYTHFKEKYFQLGGFKNREHIANSDTFPRIMSDLKEYAFSLPISKEYCPLAIVPIRLKLPANVSKIYDEMKKNFYIELGDRDIFALGSAPLTNKLRQIEAGAIYDNQGDYHTLHTLQLDAVEDLVEELNGHSLIIVYEFKFQLKLIMDRFPKAVSKITSQTKRKWDMGETKILAIHPKSCGHGLNLQAGGANMVFLSTPWSMELWQQTIGRIYRLGQNRSVSVFRFEGFEVEDRVYRRLKYHGGIEDKAFKELSYAT